MGATQKFDESAIETFDESIRGELIRPGEEGYEESRTVWNAMVDKEPALIAKCEGVADVISAVNFARERELLLAVKSGGHNVAGDSVCEDGLVIDLSPMKSVRVDPEAKTARVEPGVTMGEFDHETQAFGLATTGGVISTTGVAGLTLGGGWGWLARTHGLAIDNLRSADVVTAAGELVHASESENEDLFWGLRGGGGNFGIVTSFEFDLHELDSSVLSGFILFPFENARELLRSYREFTAEAPDELCCYVGIQTAPNEPFVPEAFRGETVVGFTMCYSGDVEAGERAIQPIYEFGDPIVDLVEPRPYAELQGMLDDAHTEGFRNYWKSQFTPGLPDELIDITVEYGKTFSTPHTSILIEHLGGAIAGTPNDATAYRHRDATYSFNIFPRWEDPDEDDARISWAREFFDDVAPYAKKGVYVNFLSDGEEDRIPDAYGEHYDRLRDLKGEWDPENLFRMNQNIDPAE